MCVVKKFVVFTLDEEGNLGTPDRAYGAVDNLLEFFCSEPEAAMAIESFGFPGDQFVVLPTYEKLNYT